MFAGNEFASVELKHAHTNITEICKNNETLLKVVEEEAQAASEDFACTLTTEMILDLAKSIDLNLVKDKLDAMVKFNSAISSDGFSGNYGVNAGKNIQASIKSGFYGRDCRNLSACAAAAASDARMGGSAMPVMTTAGSGNVGLAVSLPIITYCRENQINDDSMYRALFFAALETVHIKAKVGRLSAFCGPMCAAAAVSGALALLNNASYLKISKAIINTLAGVSGIFCDGANSSCAVKIANGTYAAYDGVAMALNDDVVSAGDGVVTGDVESTINNIAELAQLGMQETDEVILQIMTR